MALTGSVLDLRDAGGMGGTESQDDTFSGGHSQRMRGGAANCSETSQHKKHGIVDRYAGNCVATSQVSPLYTTDPQVARQSTTTPDSARLVLNGMSGEATVKNPKQPWQRAYRTVGDAIDAILNWRRCMSPDDRAIEWGIARDPLFPDQLFIVPIGMPLVFAFMDETVESYEKDRAKRLVKASTRHMLEDCMK